MKAKYPFPVFALVLSLSLSTLQAQQTKEQRIQDSIIGWWNTLGPADKPVKPLEYNGRTFSTKQQEINNLIVRWMQQSYSPIGGIGRFNKYYYADKRNFPPQGYGTMFRTYNVGYKDLDKNGHFKPIEEEWTPFYVNVNAMSFCWDLDWMNTKDEYYFAMPNNYSMDNTQTQKIMEAADPKVHPNVYKYIQHTTNRYQTVYLAPGNKMPIIALTKGEYLDNAERSVDRWLAKQLADLKDKYGKDQRSIDGLFPAYQQDAIKFQKGITTLRTKYSNRLNEPADLNTQQPDIRTIDGFMDPFLLDNEQKSRRAGSRIYCFDPAVYPAAKSDQPQWIAISFPFEREKDGTQLREQYLAMTENFNYDYIYNYFFDPEKVKGIPYHPNYEAGWKARLATHKKANDYANSTPVTTTAMPAGAILYDDFTANADGASPKNWFYNNRGKQMSVVSFPGEKGKWIKMGYNNRISPTILKTLPDDFSIEYDLRTDNFTGMTGGEVRLYLSGNASVDAWITAGNQTALNEGHNYRGTTRLFYYNGPNATGMVDKPQSSFTNTQQKAHIKLTKKGSALSLYINGKLISTNADLRAEHDQPCPNCTIPKNIKFNKLEFENRSQDAGNVSVYISNIKITKE